MPTEPPRLKPERIVRLGPRARLRYLSERSPTDSGVRRALDLLSRAGDVELARACRAVLEMDPQNREEVGRAWRFLLEVLARNAGDREEPFRGSQESPPSTSGQVQPSLVAALPCVVFVPEIRSPFNLGSIIRSAAAFGVIAVVAGHRTPALEHRRVQRAAMGADRMIPLFRGDLAAATALVRSQGPVGAGAPIPSDDRPVLVALEPSGDPIGDAPLSRGSVVVVGHEEDGIPPDILGRVRVARNGGDAEYADGRITAVPHRGPKRSLNVAVALGAALAVWQVNAERAAIRPG